ncbi:MAG: FAD-binding protein [Treponema sp.]|nr:FAD-binding protein [Treponema sp.]
MKKEVSRRNFIKGAAVTAAAITAAGLIGCKDKEPAGGAKQQYKPGTYRAKAYGNISYITVETVFTETAIKSIKVIEQKETPVLFEQVEKKYIPALIESQAGGIDTIAGATNSSRAIREAVADCIRQAGGDAEAWLNRKVALKPGADEKYDADIVVIGVGAAGFVAACHAGEQGAKVIAIEKGGSVASVNGIKVSGPFAVETDVLKNKEGGTTLKVDDAFYHVMNYTHWTPNPKLMRNCLEQSKNAVALLEKVGYKFKEVNFRFETPFIGQKGGFHLILNDMDERVALWNKALDAAGVKVLFNTAAKKILRDSNNKITGVTAERSDGTKITVNAKAVIMTSGGYLGNRDMQERFLGTRKLNAASGGASLCTGDGINMAIDIGAGLDKTFGYCPCEYGGTNSKATRPAKQDKYDQNLAFKFGLYGCLLVDAEGKRFINEGLLCDYPMSYGSEQILRNAPWYAVVDQAYVDTMATKGLYEYTTAKGANSKNWFIGNYFKGRILKDLPADIEEGIKEGWCYKADTIEDLAKHFGLTDLAETVKQYNGYCANGKDEQFGTNPWYLSPVSQGPFYVVQNEPSAWSTFGGIRIDDCCRALNSSNEIVRGLYVAGTDAGSLYYSPYYDIPGYCYGLCIDSGYIAATNAVKEIRG